MDKINELKEYIKTLLQENKNNKTTLLNDLTYIEKIIYQLEYKDIENIDIKNLAEVINKIGIEEDDIFLQLQKILEKFSVESFQINENITKEQEIRIDNSPKYFGEIRHERENGDIVLANDIYLYGEVDFNNIDDLKYIEKFKLLFTIT